MLVSLLHVLSTTDLATAAAAASNPAASFIRTSCGATTYPKVCVQSLQTYASSIQRNPRKLVMTALSVTVDRAQSTRAFVSKLTKFRGLKPREYAAIKDCLEEVNDSVDRLTKSVKELKRLGHDRGRNTRGT
jgi:pectinesterase inhibitor-like protein